MTRPGWILLFAVLFGTAALAAESEMDAEIDYLLAAVAESDCEFIRNGKEYDGEDARDHLQMKRERGRKYYDSSEEFIERIASKSSWSGKPYRIRCGSVEENAGDWFMSLLKVFREESTAGDTLTTGT
ncbi:MAG: DUF5329 domain-containing protein [Woeseiaceae bacterium]